MKLEESSELDAYFKSKNLSSSKVQAIQENCRESVHQWRGHQIARASGVLILLCVLMVFLFQRQGEESQVLTEGEKQPQLTERIVWTASGHMEAIASDQMEGRFTASDGYRKSAEYASRVFKEVGLAPAFLDANGESSYFQEVPFFSSEFGDQTYVSLRKGERWIRSPHASGEFAVLSSGDGQRVVSESAPVFVGYGISEPRFGWDDYADVKVEGKWVVLMEGRPEDSALPSGFPDTLISEYSNGTFSRKFAKLEEKGALGAIVLSDSANGGEWRDKVLRRYRFDYLQYSHQLHADRLQNECGIPAVLLGPKLAATLMENQEYDPMSNAGTYSSFSLQDRALKIGLDGDRRQIHCHNVGAVMPGTDPALRDQFVIVCAHLDHLGKVGTDIYNGANDDASGCVAILQAAYQLRQTPLGRSVMFVLFTGEELGMVGSRHFVDHAPMPLVNVSLSINIEQIGSVTRDWPGVAAFGPVAMERHWRQSTAGFDDNNYPFYHALNSERVFLGTDTENFVARNVPSMIIGSGKFKEYHTPEDTIDLIDFAHLENAVSILQNLIQRASNP